MSKARLQQLNKQLTKEQKPTAKTETKAKPRTEEKSIEANIPRGERSSFLKVTITMPAELLSALREEGMRRKAEGLRDTDVSSLIRESVTQWLKKQ